MNIYGIGDLHLALDERINKPMDIFGKMWKDHHLRVYENFHKIIKNEDLTIICGDISWGLRIEEAKADLDWIDKLPGRKLIFKGNHDLWWQSTGKLNKLYEGTTIKFMQNTAHIEELDDGRKIGIVGTRGWICPGTEGFSLHDKKLYDREVLRLKMSMEDLSKHKVDEVIGVLHYPPTNDKKQVSEFTKLFSEYKVKHCIYGHLHGKDAFKNGITGNLDGVNYHLVSLDYVDAMPMKIEI